MTHRGPSGGPVRRVAARPGPRTRRGREAGAPRALGYVVPATAEPVEEQERAIEAFCQEIGWQLVQTYEEPSARGVSALRRALACAARREVDFVVAFRSAAIIRLDSIERITSTLHQAGAGLVCLKEGFCSPPRRDPQLIALVGAWSRFQRTIARAAGGRGRAPYGWKMSRGQVVANPLEQRVIRKMLALSREGLTPAEISYELNLEGVRSRRGAWSSQSVKRVLAVRARPRGFS